MAAKTGGPDVETNKALADALDAARAANVPKDTTNAAIARATSVDQADYKESSFEAYGHGGVVRCYQSYSSDKISDIMRAQGIFIDVLTDNPNRAAGCIRAVVARNNMKLASPGSVAFNFDRKGVIRVNTESVTNEDEFFEVAIEAGAEECDPDSTDSDFYRIITAQSDLSIARKSLTENGYNVDSAVLEMVPKLTVDVSEEDAERNLRGMDLLEDIDDVDAVFSNMSA